MFQIFVIIILSFLTPQGSQVKLVSGYLTAQSRPFDSYIENNRFTEAKNELKAAFKIKPDSSKAYLLLAEVRRGEGDISDATKYARDAIKYQPDYGEAYYFLGVLLFQTNKPKDARQTLQT